MAIKRLTIDGYGQVELNNCAFRRDGRIEAQCAPDSAFSTVPVENGMLLEVDNVNRVVKFASDTRAPYALVYSAEHQYDERKGGLKDFALAGTDDFYPRLGYLALGDKFTENCVCYDTSDWANDAALISALAGVGTTPIYGGACSAGAIQLMKSEPTYGPMLKVVKKTTMPDGSLGIKFQVLRETV